MNSDIKYELERYHLDDLVDWNRIDGLISNRNLVGIIDEFVLNLKHDHDVPGKIIEKLLGIGHWYREHNMVTKKQKRFATLTITGYWNELKDEYRYYI